MPHHIDDPAAARYRSVQDAAGLRPNGPPRGTASNSNDVWLIDDAEHGPAVLRICYRGDPHRLIREAAVLTHLPDDVLHPELLASGVAPRPPAYPGGPAPGRLGDNPPLTWTLTRRLLGRPLTDIWPHLPDDRRRSAQADTADTLRALHCWRPPEAVRAELLPRHHHQSDIRSITGTDINPLPVDHTLALVPAAAELPHVDPQLIEAVHNQIISLADCAPLLDDTSTGLAHGDLHPSNLWWTGTPENGRITALLDFEWVRYAPGWLDLERPLAHSGTPVAEHFATDYPELFTTDRLPERLHLASLAYSLRHLVIWPPDAPEDALRPDHPLRRLRHLATTPTAAT